MIEQSRAECEHRLRALTRAADASLFEPLLNDLFAGRFDSAPPMASLRFHVPFGMERRARPPPIRLHLLPALRTDCLRYLPSPCCNSSYPGISAINSAVAAPPCLPSHQMSAADALPPHAHISANISSAPRTNFAFASSRFIARSLGFSHPILPVYPLSSSLNIGMHPPPPAPLRLPTIGSTL